jgi:hypothetical protein
MPTWFTVDSDDLRHLPKHQGHPTRSNAPFDGHPNELSSSFLVGWRGFVEWMASHDGAVTLFLITDLLENNAFVALFGEALGRFPQRLTVGCHGHSHRSWSAWGDDEVGFSAMLATSTALLKEHAGDAFRPFFRAPNGYVAPWMAPVLAEHGYTVDSSVNPSWLVVKKAGGASWSEVQTAMARNGVIERPWLTRWSLPVNGPALFRFPLSLLARRAWKRTSRLLLANEVNRVEDAGAEVTTLYCHVLDFARNEGQWAPPLPTKHNAT